jgi:hypothetical protein
VVLWFFLVTFLWRRRRKVGEEAGKVRGRGQRAHMLLRGVGRAGELPVAEEKPYQPVLPVSGRERL